MRSSTPWIAAAAALLLALAAVVVRQAWLSDDCYITLRSVENWVTGHGLRWNAAERVQTFTHPLWMLLLAAGRVVTGEAYFTSIALCLLFSVAAVLLLLRLGGTAPVAAVLLALLLGSRSFTEYATGGLENPLTFALIAAFALVYCSALPPLRKVAAGAWITGLAMTTRMDLAALLGPPLLALGLTVPREPGWWRAVLWRLLLGMTPFVLWELCAVVYYGSPFPITAHAKAFDTGIPAGEVLLQGLHFVVYVATRDPLTLLVILGGIGTGLWRRELGCRALALGTLLYCGYVVKVGGDFMGGRFATPPFFAALTILARGLRAAPWPRRWLLAPIGAAALLLVLPGWPAWARPPAADQPPTEADEVYHGIVDERCFYYWQLGLLSPERSVPQPAATSDTLRALGRTEPIVMPWGQIGRYGFEAGPLVHIVDSWLCDPLLMRLPVGEPKWRVGHIIRHVPEGYFETLASGDNRLHHEGLRRYYDTLRLALRGPVFGGDRWAALWRLWTGAHDADLRAYIAEDYAAPPRIVVPAARLAQLPAPAPLVWWQDQPQSVVVYRGGLEVRFDAAVTARRVHVSVGDHQRYELTFRRDGQALGTVAVENLLPLTAGQQRHTAELPAEVAAFDSIWIDVPTQNSQKLAVLSGLVVEP